MSVKAEREMVPFWLRQGADILDIEYFDKTDPLPLHMRRDMANTMRLAADELDDAKGYMKEARGYMESDYSIGDRYMEHAGVRFDTPQFDAHKMATTGMIEVDPGEYNRLEARVEQLVNDVSRLEDLIQFAMSPEDWHGDPDFLVWKLEKAINDE